RFVVSASLDEIARRFRKDQHHNNQDNCLFVEVSDVETLSKSLQKAYPSKRDGNWNAIGPGVIPILGRIQTNCGQKEADGDCPLVAADNSAPNPFGCGLRLIQRDCCAQEANS